MSVLIDDVSLEIDGRRILDSIRAEFDDGTVTGVLGPNGAGKSTLLRVIAGIDRPTTGRVLLDADDVHTLRRREAAQRIALLEQSAELAAELTVIDVVLLGRIPHRRGLLGSFDSHDDRVIALRALESVGAVEFAARSWHSLSGGERQRVQIARALAQEPRMLLLDEPTNHLDVSAQLSLLSHVRKLGLTSVAAIHDLNLAAAYCDKLIVLSAGNLVAAGTPTEVLTPELIRRVYGTESDVIRHPRHGGPLVVFAMDGAVGAGAVGAAAVSAAAVQQDRLADQAQTPLPSRA
jgi:iron complex transport system ATP-binding protein